MPRSYQFFYKGSTCAYRQEGMRRAWELLPKCALIERKANVEENKVKSEAVSEAQSQRMEAATKSLEAGATRRVSNKLVAVPLLTLARLQEDTGLVHLLHKASDFIVAGDILKLGNVKGRDYIVAIMDAKTQKAYPNMCIIEPVFSMLSELDFDRPTAGNIPWPKPAALDPKMRFWIPKGPQVCV